MSMLRIDLDSMATVGRAAGLILTRGEASHLSDMEVKTINIALRNAITAMEKVVDLMSQAKTRCANVRSIGASRYHQRQYQARNHDTPLVRKSPFETQAPEVK